MCSYSPHIRLKFGEIRFINQGFITKNRASVISPQNFRGPYPQNWGSDPKTVVYRKHGTDVLIYVPSLVEIGLRTATRERKSESFVFLFCSSRWAWPILVSQTCRDVRHFNEVQLRHLLIDFHGVWGVFKRMNHSLKWSVSFWTILLGGATIFAEIGQKLKFFKILPKSLCARLRPFISSL